ncbi:MAG: phosphate signaling complex protein PhoU [Hominenteromicrobium sp.]
MRNRFEEQLERLNVELIRMGALCEDAISQAAKTLETPTDEMRRIVYETEREIDRKEREIESLCMRLLLQQQPVASDLRLVSSALKMISDMERIGDQAADIAEMTEHIRGTGMDSRLHIAEMARATVKMVTDSVDSFVRHDLDLAHAVERYDDVVDELFNRVKNEIVALIAEKPGEGETCIDLLMVAKYFERIGDHAVNISEWVEFSATGQHG